MSFKREGDDMQLLNRLKLKRVNELLGEHIPEDEAKLLCNGRLTCLICSRRPIFDTINILVVHRKGKKHIAELHKYLEHKQKLKFREEKRIQLENLKKERELNKPVLGSKIIESDRYKPKQTKKKIIDITSKNPVGVVNQVPSASSQVRRYLKEISKKTPLSQVVIQQKESYPAPTVTEMTIPSEESLPEKNKEFKHDNKNNKTEFESSLLSKHLSGWIRDKFGNLMRDPDAEFDSSEEETESLPKD